MSPIAWLVVLKICWRDWTEPLASWPIRELPIEVDDRPPIATSSASPPPSATHSRSARDGRARIRRLASDGRHSEHIAGKGAVQGDTHDKQQSRAPARTASKCGVSLDIAAPARGGERGNEGKGDDQKVGHVIGIGEEAHGDAAVGLAIEVPGRIRARCGDLQRAEHDPGDGARQQRRGKPARPIGCRAAESRRIRPAAG